MVSMARSLSPWSHVVCMLFAQLTHAIGLTPLLPPLLKRGFLLIPIGRSGFLNLLLPVGRCGMFQVGYLQYVFGSQRPRLNVIMMPVWC